MRARVSAMTLIPSHTLARGGATRQCMQKKSFDLSFAMMAG